MTCKGCQNFVKQKIESLEDVISAEVSLERGIATINSKKTISENILSNILGSKYSVKTENNFKNIQNNNSKLKQLRPLILIFTYIITVTFFYAYYFELTPKRGMQIFMGLFFIVFSFFKFLDYKGFPGSFKRYDPIAKIVPFYAEFYPFLETGLGISYLLEFQILISITLTILILSMTTFGVTKTLFQKSQIQCACLGTALKLPMTEATLIENGIMLTMSSLLLLDYIL
tara:strand:+ start:161 stop:847 length:687 start_codon:yes stop_codon:yes gene_type:complete